MPSLEPIKGKISVLGFKVIIIIQIKSAILFAILAIPDNSVDVHFHLQRQLHSINNGCDGRKSGPIPY
jgi:hypothetical protein